MQYYEKSRNEEQLVRCYYILEDYDSLENLVDQLQSSDSLLPKVSVSTDWKSREDRLYSSNKLLLKLLVFLQIRNLEKIGCILVTNCY